MLIRNYFAHYNPSEKKYIPKDSISLNLLIEEMRIILEANILHDLGLPNENIIKFIKITKGYVH